MTTKMKDKVDSEQQRGRPGRRSASDRIEAVRALLSGKASVEQLSQKYAVTQETIEDWRAQALDAMETALRPGTATSSREQELQREHAQLSAAVTRLVMEKELLQRALETERQHRPSRPSRWRR